MNIRFRQFYPGFCLSVLLLLTACSSGNGGTPLAFVEALRPQAAYADKLKPCLRDKQRQVSCELNALPLLGMQYAQPTREHLAERVAVSHPWMGQRFEEALAQLPDDILALTPSLSGLVIASDIRPAFYWRHTGAVYIDPDYLWLSVEEKRSIDPAPDFRLAFGQNLNFRVLARYVLGNNYAWTNYSLEDDSERSLADILPALARLLYHEFAHANDFIPQTEISSLNPLISVAQAVNDIESRQGQISQGLSRDLALQSNRLFELAEVNFLGRNADSEELALQASDISAEFSQDAANDDYNYLTPYEDLAMLFEESMMYKNYGIQRDIAVCITPTVAEPNGRDYFVDWGQRGRLGEPAVKARAEYISQRMLPQADFSEHFANLPAPIAMRSGEDWIANLNLNSAAKQSLPARPLLRGLPQQQRRDRLPE